MTKSLAYRVLAGDHSKASARLLAAELLAFAGPERNLVFRAVDPVGDILEATFDSFERTVVVRVGHEGRWTGAFINPAQIDDLITWLQGHREDYPS